MDAESQDTKKRKFKAGNIELEFDGPLDEYDKATIERFMSVVEKMGERMTAQGALVAPAPAISGSGIVTPAAPITVEGDAPPIPLITSTSVSDEMMNRVFRRDADSVSLLALPRTDDGGADALMLLLYGYQRLMSRSAVSGYALIRAARQSGINMPRVDTVIAKRGDYVLAAGNKRGRVYSLNNRGSTYAEGVLRRTLE